MSTLFGIFHRDGKPVSNELELMYSGIQHFPHERYNFKIQENCGFGHLLTYNTPEAIHENMPRYLEAAHLLFMAEGRIDNRDELFKLLAIPANEQNMIPDGDLILQTYLKYGEQCIDRLLGKWSLAAFHTDSQKLFIARDQWDYTAIDYYIDDKVIAFSSSSKGIFPLPFISPEIDELVMARLLVVWPGDFDKTYYKGIKRVLPSHTLTITRENESSNRYWDYKDISEKPGLTLEAYCEALLDSMNKAVSARLRSYKPVAATLSGGMDSSTVCALAARQLAGQNKQLRTYSHVPRFQPSATLTEHNFGNERPFIEFIAQMYPNIDAVYTQSETISPIEGIKEAIRMFGEPFHGAGNAYWMVDIYKKAVCDGYGTVLMGEFGNSTISWTGMEDAIPVQEVLKRYGLLRTVKKKVLKPMLYGDTPVASIYKRVVCGCEPWRKIAYSTPAFEQSLHLARQIKESGFDTSFMRYFKEAKQNAFLIFDVNVMRLPFGAYAGYSTGLELRDPTNDIRVIKSAMEIPNEVFLGKMNKQVLRTMTKGILPDEVRLNLRKGKQSSDITGRLAAYPEEMEAMLKEMQNAGFGKIADLKRIEKEWTKLKADSTNYPLDDVFHFLRPVAAYWMWKSNFHQ
nr:asparagine synthase-related protein [uncultured Draconibacterium sp.]